LTSDAPEMDVFVGMMIGFAPPAQGKVIFAIVRDDFMGDSIFAEPVQYPVDRNPVHLILYLLFKYILAQRGRGGFQQLQHHLFGGGVSSVHDCIFIIAKILQLGRRQEFYSPINDLLKFGQPI
jgi:hypothetical protein